jgi:hypothetical protein
VPSGSRDGDDAEASDWRTFVISDCQDDVTRAQRRRVGGRRRRQPVRLEAQHGDVSAGIAARQRGRDHAPQSSSPALRVPGVHGVMTTELAQGRGRGLHASIRFPLSQPIPAKLIERIAKLRAKEVAEREAATPEKR